MTFKESMSYAANVVNRHHESRSTASVVMQVIQTCMIIALIGTMWYLKPGYLQGRIAIKDLDSTVETLRDKDHASMFVDEEGVINIANPRMGNLMDGNSDTLWNKPLIRYIHPDYKAEFRESFTAALMGERVYEGSERLKIVTIRGREKWISIQWEAVRTDPDTTFLVGMVAAIEESEE